MRLKVKPEGRKDIFIPEKESLKKFIKFRKLTQIHNFVPITNILIGADHSVKSVLEDIDRATRLGIFTNPNENVGHSLALIFGNYDKGDVENLECYDIGKITLEDLEIL